MCSASMKHEGEENNTFHEDTFNDIDNCTFQIKFHCMELSQNEWYTAPVFCARGPGKGKQCSQNIPACHIKFLLPIKFKSVMFILKIYLSLHLDDVRTISS